MITATFIFRQLSYDDPFRSLNERIDHIALSSKGYLGRKTWSDDDENVAVVYYWKSMEALASFREDSTHKLAKSRYAEWYAGYRIEIAEVNEIYGDGFFDSQFPALLD